MNKLLIALALSISLPAFSAGQPGDVINDIKTMPAGSVDVMDVDFEPAAEPIVGNREILEATASKSPSRVKVTLLKKGSSSVIVTDKLGHIRMKLIYNVIAQ